MQVPGDFLTSRSCAPLADPTGQLLILSESPPNMYEQPVQAGRLLDHQDADLEIIKPVWQVNLPDRRA
jgi:hypothetical protein